MCAVPARREAEFLVESAGYRGKSALAALSEAELRKHPLRRFNVKRQEVQIEIGEWMLPLLQMQFKAAQRLLTGRIRHWQTWAALALTGTMAGTYLVARSTFSLVVFLWTLGLFFWFLFSEDAA
jgi:hypothetical protein